MRRSAFLSSTAALAGAAFLRNVTLASAQDVANDDFAVLVQTIVPFGAPAFPSMTSTDLLQRINRLFALSASPAFMGSLEAFSDLGSFSKGSELLFAAEMSAVPGADVHQLVRADAAAFDATGLSSVLRFDALNAADRKTYLRLWSQSAFSSRRRFYGSVRAVTFIALYSMPQTWPAIGYAGPLLHRTGS